jgi:hypothetical protein
MASTSDWRSARTADALKHLDRAGFAAEFLRRNPLYRKDYLRMTRSIAAGKTSPADARMDLAQRWGLSFPFRPAPEPRRAAAGPVAPGAGPDRGGSRRRSR